jgi:hypothetical protein
MNIGDVQSAAADVSEKKKSRWLRGKGSITVKFVQMA